jgi:hypothetical protein
MKQHHPLLRLGLLVALFFLPLATFSEAISTLRCEYAVTPLFVDTPAPRLTWCYGDTLAYSARTAIRCWCRPMPG